MRHIPQIKRVAEGTAREQIAIALCQLSVEHHSGIITLTQNSQWSPAFALFRPQMEAWLRSQWVRYIVTEDRLAQFMSGDATINPPPRQIILAIPDEEERAVLINNYDTTWSGLCDYTHGGAMQIKARLQPDGIETKFPDDHIAGLVNASTRLAYLAMMEMAELLKDEELHTSVHSLFVSIYPPNKSQAAGSIRY